MAVHDPNSFYDQVATLIRDARIASGISQEVMANQLGLTRASIINIEKGRHRPSLHLLIEIAEILNVSYTSLIPTSSTITKTKAIPKHNLDEIISDDPKFDKTTVRKFLASIHKPSK